MALNVGHTSNQLCIGNSPADAETRHGILFGNPIDQNEFGILDTAFEEIIAIDGLLVIEYQSVVNIVHDQVNAPFFTKLNYFTYELFGIHDPGRIVGTIDDYRFGI